MNLPWYMASPSPFSIIWYCLFGYIGIRKGLKPLVSAWLVGFTSITSDTLWIIASGLRFYSYNPAAMPHLILCLLRNILALSFFIILYTDTNLKLELNKLVFITWTLNISFLAMWFLAAPNPSYTDWTYAYLGGYGLERILLSFFTSHIIGRLFLLNVFLSWFNNHSLFYKLNELKKRKRE